MHHVEQIRQNNSLPNLKQFSLFNNGAPSVSFFFVLSGFLITYLLLREWDNTHTISIRHFYLKRALRIWPLYFMLVFIGFVLLPLALPPSFHDKFPYLSWQGLAMYVFFLPNLAKVMWPHSLLIPLWSIGVEEQFYLAWAPLAKWCRNYLVPLLFAVIAIVLVLNYYCVYQLHDSLTRSFLLTLNFDFMAIGGLFAWYYHLNKGQVPRSIFYAKSTQYIALVYLLTRLLARIWLMQQSEFISLIFSHFFITKIDAIAFGIIILNIGTNPHSIIKPTHPILEKLGTTSYGMYMYHMLFVFPAALVLKKYATSLPVLVQHCMMYATVLGATILASYLSYEYVEKRILNLKSSFEKP